MNMNRLRRSILSIIFALSIGAAAWGQWTINSAAVSPNPITYAFADIQGLVSIQIRSPARNMPFWITVDGGAPEYLRPRRVVNGANWIEYDIYDNMTNRNVILPVTDGSITVANVLSGITGATRRATVTCPLFVPELQGGSIFRSGTYSYTLTVRVYAGTFVQGAYPVASATRNMTVSIRILNTYVGVQIADTGGAFGSGLSAASLDFGTLTSGETAGKDVVVKSNLPYTLRFSSLHGGSLAPASGTTPNIGYSFAFEGTTRSLVIPWTSGVYTALSPTLGEERNHPLLFTIGTVNVVGQAAGIYSDTLTVTLTTQ